MESNEQTVIKKRFLDISSAAAMQGLSVRHFRRLLKERKIPIIKIGRKHFILFPNEGHIPFTPNGAGNAGS
jgi:hypothetical protein